MRPFVGGLALVLLAYVGLAWLAWFVCDDAFISYRYAWQWAHGHGVRFNVTDARPVEGYSDFLWVAFAALAERVGLPAFRVMPWVSIACGVGNLVLVERLARDFLGVGSTAAWLVTFLLALSPPFVVWGTGGLEAMAHAFAWLLAFHGLGPSRARWGPAVGALALLASMLLRAEGFAWGGGVLLAAALARWSQGRSWREGWLRPLVLAVVAYVAYQGWRYGYYHRAFPNTVYAKVDPSLPVFIRGGTYVAGFFVTLVTPLLVVPALAPALRGPRGRRALPILLLALGPMAFAVVVGGDFMTFWRLLVPALAPLALLAAPALDALERRRPGRVVPLAAALAGVGFLPLVNVHLLPHAARVVFDVRGPWPDLSEHAKWRSMRDAARGWFVEGVALRQVTEAGDSIVLGPIGATGYAAPDVVIHDLYGLVTPEVSRRELRPRDISVPGHDKEVPLTFFYDERPTIFGFRLYRATDLPGELDEAVRVMLQRDKRHDYAPDLRVVPALSVPGCPVAALTIRYLPERADREAARAAFAEARASIVGEPEACAAVPRLRDHFAALSRRPIPFGVEEREPEPGGASARGGKDGRGGKDARDGERARRGGGRGARPREGR